jgi:phosphoribosyl 1,2-cyclic phosphodiesterase
VIDAGTGFYEFGSQIMTEHGPNAVKDLNLLFTHYHNDHVNGLSMCPLMFVNSITKHLFGPVDMDNHNLPFGPLAALENEFSIPRFPVTAEKIREAIGAVDATPPEVSADDVICFYRDERTMLKHSTYRRIVKGELKQIEFGEKLRDPDKVLFVRAFRCVHPQVTLAYRFEEFDANMNLQAAFVLLTDHEAQVQVTADLASFLRGVDFLAVDCQYSMAKYKKCAGFGHGNPRWVAALLKATDIARIGLIHHDPAASDEVVDAVREEVLEFARAKGVDIKHRELLSVADGQQFTI